ncbi:Flp pilus assembly protein CpaB [Magnetovibrio sp.]|uniref:Flp pilus assembly protein CpaB n=1 Tax=Magnetovibrio sp. TaxID=2024836 RepID=UPI002F93A3F7
MRIVIIGLVFAAIILAGGTAYLLNTYLSSQEAEIASKAPKAPTTQVLVAKADLPTGTVVNDSNTQWVPWPEDAVQEAYLVKTRDSNPMSEIIKDKHVTRRAISKGDPITMVKLYKADNAGFMRGSLRPGMRAIAVKASADSASGGFILPGDNVDVMLTHNLLRRAMERTGSTSDDFVALEYTSETIMENLRVLAIDQNVSEFQGGAVLGKTVLLEVTPKQAEKLNTAKVMGTLYLVLRSAETGETEHVTSFTTDVEVSPLLSSFKSFMSGTDPRLDGNLGATADEMADGGGKPIPVAKSPAPEVKPAPAPQPRAAPKPKAKRDITIYRGAGTPAQAVALPSDAGDIIQ